MAPAIFTIVLTLLITTVIAAPTNQIKKRSFKVHRVENPNYVANGKMALKRAYLKYGIDEGEAMMAVKRSYLSFGIGDIQSKPNGEVGARVKAANSTTGQGTEDGETPAKGTQNDAQFLSPISVGGQQLVVNFDSGSSDLWVFSDNLPAASRRGHQIYDSSKSSTVEKTNNQFKISYGDGSNAAGPVVLETVDIGGSTVEKQAVGVPTNVSSSFIRDTASNGLVGLAFSQLNTVKPQKQKTFFANVAPNLSQAVFTAQLKGGTVGAYEFGRIDETAFQGTLEQVPVDSSRGFWEFESSRAVVNGNETKIAGTAIADTGTSLMLVGNDLLQAYWGQVAGAEISDAAGGVIFPCNTELPDLEIAAGDVLTKVDGVNLNFATVGQRTNGEPMCFGGLQSNGGLGLSIYGDVWFKSLFVAFQADGPSLGVARHA